MPIPETPQQYTQRILSNVGDADPWEVLASTPARLRQLVDGRTQHDLQRRSAPDRWSVREILAHLADCEVVAGWRLRSILASSGTALQAFDQNRWAEVFKYPETSADRTYRGRWGPWCTLGDAGRGPVESTDMALAWASRPRRRVPRPHVRAVFRWRTVRRGHAWG
ncbi:MAG: hypothetical protein GEU99_16045 [Luteitalea sp.]|nr:hypothetical protein [Luteitalea sp.]